MNRIIAIIFVVAFLGGLLFAIGCGPSGYETGSDDPSQGPQEGADTEKEPVPIPDTFEGEAPPPAPEGE